jgi:GNAT superfamily N-acetyltransferase
MPAVNVVVGGDLDLSIRARQVCGMFDCPPEKKQTRKWVANLPIEDKPWNIGLIVGPSGCGKTTCARKLWPEEYEHFLRWDDRSIIDAFPATRTVEEISAALNSVGFSTVPAWLRPYHVLSNGEKFRADIARRMLEQDGLIVIDEFTSVVDRQVASVACHSVQKFTRKNDRQLVAVTCHHDVIEWLQPDWVFQPATLQFEWRCLRRRPDITIEVARLPYKAWDIFAPYHYLTAELNKAAACFGLWANGTLAAFIGVLHRPHAVATNLKAVSRVITLPDWQGLGLAFVLMETVASAYKAMGFRFCNYPSHPQFVRAHRKGIWKCNKKPGKPTSPYCAKTAKRAPGTAKQRPCAVFEYVGPAMQKRDAEHLLARGTQ